MRYRRAARVILDRNAGQGLSIFLPIGFPILSNSEARIFVTEKNEKKKLILGLISSTEPTNKFFSTQFACVRSK